MAPPPRVRREPTLRQIHARLGIPADYGEQHGLRRERPARSLVAVGRNPDGRRVKLSPRAAAAWHRMRAAAATDGITLLPISGYRSIARQTYLIRAKLSTGQQLEDILRFIAAPGYSEHHTGKAIDIGSPDDLELDEQFEGTPAFHWLERNARRFGFRMSYPRHATSGIGYEPWHWCWQAKPVRQTRGGFRKP